MCPINSLVFAKAQCFCDSIFLFYITLQKLPDPGRGGGGAAHIPHFYARHECSITIHWCAPFLVGDTHPPPPPLTPSHASEETDVTA